MRRQEAAAHIAAELSAVLGPHMARAAVDGHCSNLGIEGEEITDTELDELLRRIGLGLHLFVGREKANELVETLRQQLNGRPQR